MADSPFRFYDNREKYLLFTTTCSENRAIARRVADEFDHLLPEPPALRVFQAGSGEGSMLNLVLRHLHLRWPTLPFFVVVREREADFLRLAVRNISDRFQEHPELVLVFTNTPYRDPPTVPEDIHTQTPRPGWRIKELTGNSSHAFERQIHDAINFVQSRWPARGGDDQSTAGVVLYRADQRFVLDAAMPKPGEPMSDYDLVIASQAYRSRLATATKVRWVLAPLAHKLRPGGRMIVVQSTGRDAGMDVVREIWPGESPFASPRGTLTRQLSDAFIAQHSDLRCLDLPADHSEFSFELQLNPEDVSSSIGTSTLLAAWNAAAYVAQIDDGRLSEAMSEGHYLDATREVLGNNRGLAFRNECFVVCRGLN